MLDPADLLARAVAARANAYAPYSQFAVGAALLAADGHIVTGANVENASYGLSMCAERVAIFRAVADGTTAFTAIAIAGPEDIATLPCGACRQVLYEFAPDLAVIVAGEDEPSRTIALEALLPEAFGPRALADAGDGTPGAR